MTPKIDSSAHSPKLKTGMRCDNSHTHNALQCNIRWHFWGEGVYSTTFDPVLRNEVKKFSYVSSRGRGYIQQLLILNSEMKDLH